MSTTTSADTNPSAQDYRSHDVFADPIRYLAGLGIVAEVVSDTSLPAAA